MTEDDIAKFQAAFLEVLDTAVDETDLAQQVLQFPCHEDLKPYLNDCDRTMLQLASILVKRWGRRR